MKHLRLRIGPSGYRELSSHPKGFGGAVGQEERNKGAEGDGPSFYIGDHEGNTIELKRSSGVRLRVFSSGVTPHF